MPDRKVEYKDINLELKKVSESGDFEGYLSTFNNVDSGGDRVWKGAFKKTLREKKKFPVLWQHSWQVPLGSFTGKEDDVGLFINGKLNLMTTEAGIPKIPKAHEAHALMLNDDIKGLSIGYDVLVSDEERIKKQTIRNLREVRLWEGSIVTFPMNELAAITDVKAMYLMQDIQKAIEDGSLSEEQIKQILALFEPTSKVIQTVEPKLWDYPETMEQLKKLKEVFLND